MSLEIERKFLIKSNDYKNESHKKSYIKQGFLNSNKHRTVRIRISDEIGFITIKGISDEAGISRYEWEKEIPVKEAEQLLLLCEKGVIEKNRYLIKHGRHIFEVDEFLKKNEGLIIAEIELSNENELFQKPRWLGKEVTGKAKYYNSNLSKYPYANWI
jgi:CYTH domain-containing protein